MPLPPAHTQYPNPQFPPGLPAPVDGAEWVAGLTDGNDHYRVRVDGEPQPLAIAARSGPRGWAKIFDDTPPETEDQGRGRVKDFCPVYLPHGKDGRPKVVIVTGRVELVPGD